MVREKVAELCHDQWSNWMEYLFRACSTNINTGEMTIPAWAVDRWKRQLSTKYEFLSQQEQESDLKEADKFIKLMEEEDEI